MSISLIKAAIKTNLDELVPATLGAVTVSDFKTNPLNADTGIFPHAFIMPPAMQSEAFENRSVLRTYSFDIVILFRGEDVTTTDLIEQRLEAIVDKFDNDPDLRGTAMGGVLPVTAAPEPFEHNGRDLVMAVVQIQAKEHVQLTFT